MANPQKEHGKTELANEILDHLCKFRIPGEVRQIVDVVIRKTYGWHKIWDRISNSQFVEYTGMKKQNANRALLKAIEHNLVIQNDDGEYAFQKNHEIWVEFKSSSKVITGKNNKIVIQSDSVVIQNDYKSSSKVMNTKYNKETNKKKTFNTKVLNGQKSIVKTSKKKIKKKKGPNPDLEIVMDFAQKNNFSLQGQGKNNRFYAYNLIRKKDSKGKPLGVDRVKLLIMAAISCQSKPFAPQVSDFEKLFYRWQDIIAFMKKEKNNQGGIRSLDDA